MIRAVSHQLASASAKIACHVITLISRTPKRNFCSSIDMFTNSLIHSIISMFLNARHFVKQTFPVALVLRKAHLSCEIIKWLCVIYLREKHFSSVFLVKLARRRSPISETRSLKRSLHKINRQQDLLMFSCSLSSLLTKNYPFSPILPHKFELRNTAYYTVIFKLNHPLRQCISKRQSYFQLLVLALLLVLPVCPSLTLFFDDKYTNNLKSPSHPRAVIPVLHLVGFMRLLKKFIQLIPARFSLNIKRPDRRKPYNFSNQNMFLFTIVMNQRIVTLGTRNYIDI